MGNDLAGKTMVITGATSGIGEAAAKALAARGARLVLVARSADRVAASIAQLPAPATGAHARHIADLSSLDEMKRVAGEIAAAEPVIDVLINNAGVISPTRQVTSDGLELTFAVNHMAYFVITLGLIEKLKAAPRARVVVTASRMHESYTLDFDDLQTERKFNGYAAYGRSKICNILFARALAKRLEGLPVVVNALHPGFVATRIGDTDRSLMGTVFNWAKVFALKPEAGARTTIHVATSPEAGEISGGYFVKCKLAKPSAAARNDFDGERLWAICERISAGSPSF